MVRLRWADGNGRYCRCDEYRPFDTRCGIFSLFLLHDNGAGGVMAAIGWFGAALVGAVISTAILLIWRRHAVKHGNYLTDGVMP
ncbi:hypothetical protein ACLK2A_04120 [Escherichia coli]